MNCEACREILSARLDGEDRPGEGAAADDHLATCAACTRWLHDAARVTRLARLAVVEVDDREPAWAAPAAPRRRPWVLAGRWVLGVLGAIQFVLGMVQVGALTSADHAHIDGVSPTHLFHESAAWNIAVGAAFGWLALRRGRPTGLIPLLTAFVVMLVLLSANDLWLGRVDGPRLLSHVVIVVGYVVVLVLARLGADGGDPPADRSPRPLWPVLGDRATDPDRGPAPPPLRLVTRAQPSMRWDRAA